MGRGWERHKNKNKYAGKSGNVDGPCYVHDKDEREGEGGREHPTSPLRRNKHRPSFRKKKRKQGAGCYYSTLL